MPGVLLTRAPSGRPGGAASRASPTAATPPTAGCCPARSPARWSRTRTRSSAQALAARRRPVDSLCLHGDSPGAVEHARAVRRALEARAGAARPLTVSSCSPQVWTGILWRMRSSLWMYRRRPVEQSVGPKNVEPLAGSLAQPAPGRRTLPTEHRRPAGQGSGIGQERRSTPRGNSRRRPGDGGGGVGGPVRSSGRHRLRSSRGPLGAHTIGRPSPISATDD